MITTLPQPPSRPREGSWVLEIPDLASGWYPHPEDRRTPKLLRPLTERSCRWAQVLGVTADELVVHVVRERYDPPSKYGCASNVRTVRLVADRPFVAVLVTEPNQYDSEYRYRFAASTQVHGGQAGRKPSLTRWPNVVPSYMRDPGIGLNRWVNWVRLSELAEISGLDAMDIIRNYAAFSPSAVYEPCVPLARSAFGRGVFNPASPDIVRVYTTELPPDFCAAETAWGGDNAVLFDAHTGDSQECWVPQSFANCVIRLAGFGYRPGQPLPEDSCEVAAPMPEQPQFQLPALPVEELRELHELRMQHEQELPRTAFRAAAQSALDLPPEAEWREAPESTDPLDGFAYYTNFTEVQSTDDGRVVIGMCDWTRGGHGPGENYAGFLAVFPKGVDITDARRDPRAILRIWFWPGELVRQLPSGSKGGLCPPEVPGDCARLVERFLLNLGYDS